MADAWAARILDTDDAVAALAARVQRVAVLGIKPEQAAGQPAHDVPKFLQASGCTVLPVPVYYPDVTHILGEAVYRTVTQVPPPVDVVVMFRRSADVAGHLADLLDARPGAVWMQLGIRDDATAVALAQAGMLVVMDRCLKIERRRALPTGQ
jgi:predicted CoA-binding protein